MDHSKHVDAALREMCKLECDERAVQPLLTQVKAIAKRGNAEVEVVFQAIWDALSLNSSKMRLAAVMLCDQLMHRSKHFRRLLVEQFPDFVEASVAPGKSLPGPQDFAEKLRSLALTVLPTWEAAFGSFLPQLSIACRYLRSLGLLPPDPNTAMPSSASPQEAVATAQARLSGDPSLHAADPATAAATTAALLSNATSVASSTLVCLQCMAVLLATLEVPVPAAAVALAQDSSLTTGACEQTLQEPTSDKMNGSGVSAAQQEHPQEAGGAEQAEAMPEGPAPAHLALSAQDAIPDGEEDALGEDGDGGVLEFEDVEWPQGSEEEDGVFEEVPEGASEGGRSEKRKLPESVQRAVAGALREGQRTIQKIHLPRLSRTLAELAQHNPNAACTSSAAEAHQSPTGAGSRQLAPQTPIGTPGQLSKRLKSLQVALMEVCEVLIANQELLEAAAAAESGLQDAEGQPRRRVLRGRNERLWPEHEPQAQQQRHAATPKDPSAPKASNPWTLTFDRKGVPQQKQPGVRRSAAAATRGTGTAGGGLELQNPEPKTIKPGALQEVLQRAPVLPPGAYLKLWESPEVQREFLQQHMTQGQVYSHWGRVDDEVHLATAQIEDMLAMRTTYHADARTPVRARQGSEHGTPASLQKQENGHASEATANADTAADDVGTAAGSREDDTHQQHVLVDHAAGTAAPRRDGRWVELQGHGMTDKEERAAAREHNRSVLARAGLEALGRLGERETEQMQSPAEKKRKKSAKERAGTVEKLQRLMSKRNRS